MSIDQIAEEAWDKIRDLSSAGNGKTNDFVAIIQAAIEKALAQPQWIGEPTAQELERRAAQASEEDEVT